MGMSFCYTSWYLPILASWTPIFHNCSQLKSDFWWFLCISFSFCMFFCCIYLSFAPSCHPRAKWLRDGGHANGWKTILKENSEGGAVRNHQRVGADTIPQDRLDQDGLDWWVFGMTGWFGWWFVILRMLIWMYLDWLGETKIVAWPLCLVFIYHMPHSLVDIETPRIATQTLPTDPQKGHHPPKIKIDSMACSRTPKWIYLPA